MSSFCATVAGEEAVERAGQLVGENEEIQATHTLKIMWLMGATCLEIAHGDVTNRRHMFRTATGKAGKSSGKS